MLKLKLYQKENCCKESLEKFQNQNAVIDIAHNLPISAFFYFVHQR